MFVLLILVELLTITVLTFFPQQVIYKTHCVYNFMSSDENKKKTVMLRIRPFNIKMYKTIIYSMTIHDITEILLKFVLNTNQSIYDNKYV